MSVDAAGAVRGVINAGAAGSVTGHTGPAAIICVTESSHWTYAVAVTLVGVHIV